MKREIIIFTAAMFLTSVVHISSVFAEDMKEIEVEKEWAGAYSSYGKPDKLVVRSDDEWIELWGIFNSSRVPAPSAPEIDFSKYMVIAVFMGYQSNGGYGISIGKIFETDDRLIVEVVERYPQEGMFYTMAITQPYHIVVIKKSDLPVQFTGKSKEDFIYIFNPNQPAEFVSSSR